MMHGNLLEPDATKLPDRPQAQAAMDTGTDPAEVAAEYLDFSEAWAALAERAIAREELVAAYAYARTGYHRGLDQLRRAGWKGFGPVPWSHRPNQGFLRALAALAKAAGRLGEDDEYERCRQLLADSDPAAVEATGL
ncbi:putative RNA-binding Zn ribbon-like protein [Saccharomonospora amisosensis]|uniref:Putative RNA-binding Zn ribbon-like protein n=1 Tax=Saccharomonospora amisosensis TaxID=1128677 RepID=A0A7X5UVH8_9PSEU|nr:DUF3151 domain-containing protein [Saccharomonospora amisosensis]NIJ14940.1 putative RNA-binding Zn ribbon-like protein [Saccharomonospora amisosensis]